MSITLKLSSLVIRTLSKPIANQIKAQAREHERFRRICISIAQGIHRVDMRLRLGALRDSAVSEKRTAAEAAARRLKPTSPTVKTEAQAKVEAAADALARQAAEAATKPPPEYHIRPLSESKAIESGATFISEAFLFLVAGSLVLFESWRSRRKTTTHREDVGTRFEELEQSERAIRKALLALEKEVLQLRAMRGESTKTPHRTLPRDIIEAEGEEDEPQDESWLARIVSYFSWGWKTEEKADSATHVYSKGMADRESAGHSEDPTGCKTSPTPGN